MNKNRLEHLAIIMDGNGRWAKQRSLKRTSGHEKGAETIRDITIYCANHQTIQTLTLYAFSTENWKRPKYEVAFLMKLLERYVRGELPTYQRENIRFMAIGDISKFSDSLRKSIADTEEKTRTNTKLTQILALNYGGRNEVVRAVQKVIDAHQEISEESIGEALDTPYENIDLLIRTSGEQRLSNYLLWQSSYSELAFTQTLWPDFSAMELDTIIHDFELRDRRYGGI